MSEKADRQAVGRHGEQLAQNYLREIGYEIICNNWRCPRGEIDIVARDGETTVIIEVRTRRDSTTEWAWMSINARKRTAIEETAYAYMEAQGNDSTWRVDVIAVALPLRGQPIIEHVQDALNW